MLYMCWFSFIWLKQYRPVTMAETICSQSHLIVQYTGLSLWHLIIIIIIIIIIFYTLGSKDPKG